MHKLTGGNCKLVSPQMSLLLETPKGLKGLDVAGRRAVVELLGLLLWQAIRSRFDKEVASDDHA